jgi:hypothetical protein
MALVLTKAPWNKTTNAGSCGITGATDSNKPAGGCA